MIKLRVLCVAALLSAVSLPSLALTESGQKSLQLLQSLSKRCRRPLRNMRMPLRWMPQ